MFTWKIGRQIGADIWSLDQTSGILQYGSVPGPLLYGLSARWISILHQSMAETTYQLGCSPRWTLFSLSGLRFYKCELFISTRLFCQQRLIFVSKVTLMVVALGCFDSEVSLCWSRKQYVGFVNCRCEIIARKAHPGLYSYCYGIKKCGSSIPGKIL